jgi:hypothetical protein
MALKQIHYRIRLFTNENTQQFSRYHIFTLFDTSQVNPNNPIELKKTLCTKDGIYRMMRTGGLDPNKYAWSQFALEGENWIGQMNRLNGSVPPGAASLNLLIDPAHPKWLTEHVGTHPYSLPC